MEKQKKILYQVNITAVFVCLLFGLFAIYEQKGFISLYFIAAAASFATSIVLVKKGKYTISYFMSVFTADLMVLIFDTGFSNNYDNSFVLYIPLLLFSYIVTSHNQNRERFILVSFTAVCILVTNLTSITPKLSALLYDQNASIGKAINMVTAFLLSWFIVHAMEKLAHDTETELRSKKETLKSSQQLLDSLNRNITQGLYRFRADGTLLYVNPAFISLFGYKTQEEILNISAYKLFEDAMHQDNFVHMISKIDSVYNQEMKLLRKDGSFFWGLISCTRITDAAGNQCFDGVVIDISNIKVIEEQLIQAKEIAEGSLDEKSRFLSIMSHEIRTPLNTIVNVSNLLQQENTNAKITEQVDMLNFSSQSLMGLVNNILDFNRIESGKLQMENAVFDFPELLQNLIHRFEPEARRKEIRMDIMLDTNIPKFLLGDSGRISQVLTNLLLNALKFTSKGSVDVSASLTSQTNSTSTVKFMVTDTGVGISKDLLPHIFDPFVQSRRQITRKHDGSGLGLWITKMLLQLMNATISVKSKEGIGSEFTFELTLPKAEVTTDHSNIATDLSKMTILLVEDNTMNIKVVLKFLERWNAKVDVATNGLQAVALHKSKRYDLILMDIHMPEMNGYEATEIIRESDKNIPIIALTADAFDETRDKAMRSGMNDFVTKPFNPDYLFNTIAKYSLILILLNSPLMKQESGKFLNALLKQADIKSKKWEDAMAENNLKMIPQ